MYRRAITMPVCDATLRRGILPLCTKRLSSPALAVQYRVGVTLEGLVRGFNPVLVGRTDATAPRRLAIDRQRFHDIEVACTETEYRHSDSFVVSDSASNNLHCDESDGFPGSIALSLVP